MSAEVPASPAARRRRAGAGPKAARNRVLPVALRSAPPPPAGAGAPRGGSPLVGLGDERGWASSGGTAGFRRRRPAASLAARQRADRSSWRPLLPLPLPAARCAGWAPARGRVPPRPHARRSKPARALNGRAQRPARPPNRQIGAAPAPPATRAAPRRRGNSDPSPSSAAARGVAAARPVSQPPPRVGRHRRIGALAATQPVSARDGDHRGVVGAEARLRQEEGDPLGLAA